MSDANPLSEHLNFTRSEWAALRERPLPLTEDELSDLAGRVEPITLAGVRDIYLPLSRLLNLRVEAQLQLQKHHLRLLWKKCFFKTVLNRRRGQRLSR